jgi:hypothetical protein
MNTWIQKYKSLRVFLCVLVLMLYGGVGALAQAGRGGVNGLVTDPTGAIVPGARVTVVNHATGVAQHTVTTAAGLYSFVSLNPGVYVVTASQKGFESVAQDNVNVSVDQVSVVNIALRVGSVSEVVTVSESVDLVEASNSTVGQLISAETIDRVPLVSRDVYELVQLSAGVIPANGTPNSSGSPAIFNARSGIDVSSYTINGALQGTVYYMLDGSPMGVAENNLASVIPAFAIPEDGVDEYRVETQNTPASYQSGGGGVISLASKSGGNQFHGDGFVYVRPNVLAANDYFNKNTQLSSGLSNQSPAFHRYQEGGAFSGPILHKKLFFFGDYEATQQRSFDSGYFTVPTAAERLGDFTADPNTVYNPLAADDPNTGMRTPITGVNSSPNCAGGAVNCIPQADLNPIALQFAAKFPAPNVTGIGPYHSNNFFGSGLDPNNAQKFDIRLDEYAGDKHRIFGRFSFDRANFGNSDLYGASNMYDPLYYVNITNGRNILVADDYTLSPTTMLQLRYSFTRHYEDQTGDPRQGGFDITTLGFPSSLASEVLYKQIPTISFSNTSTIGGTGNWDTFIFASENSDAIATLTKVKGRHELSAGFEYMKRFMNVGQPPFPSGNYYFDMSATDQTSGAASPVGGNDFASFLLGMGTAPGGESTNFTKDLFVASASPYYAAFIEDTYHLTPTLTITAGLRWDIFGGKTERHNRLEYFDPNAAGSSNGVNFTGGEVFASSGNRTPFLTNWKDLGPRVGLAYQPSKDFVIHAGGGFYYGPSVQMVSGAGQDSDGYSSATNWNSTNWNNDPNTINFDGGGSGNSVLYGSSLDPNFTGGPAPTSTSPYTVSNPFPNGVTPLIGATQGLATYLGSQRTQTTYNYNVGWEASFPRGIVLSAGYVGSRGLFLPLAGPDLNQLDLGTIAKYKDALINTSVPNIWGPIMPSTNQYYGSPTVPLWVALQQFPQFGQDGGCCGSGVTIHGYPGGDSEYNSLQTKLQKRLTAHFTTLTTFTWGKIMSDDGNPPLGFVGFHAGAAQDWKNLNYEHSVSPQDVKYQFTSQVSYDLPVGKGRALNLSGPANQALGGWTINGVLYLSDGVPIASPGVGAGTSYFNQRTNLSCNPAVGAPHTASQWFLPNCFTNPASPFVAGTAPAYLGNVRTMGADELDVSLFKNFSLGKERDLRLEFSSYNIANKPQFSAPNVSSLGSGYVNFGQILSDSNQARQFQFGSRFTF